MNKDLSDMDRRLLDFAARAPRATGAREEGIIRFLDMSPIRFYQRLNYLVDDPAANREYPVLMARLRRQRSRE